MSPSWQHTAKSCDECLSCEDFLPSYVLTLETCCETHITTPRQEWVDDARLSPSLSEVFAPSATNSRLPSFLFSLVGRFN